MGLTLIVSGQQIKINSFFSCFKYIIAVFLVIFPICEATILIY